MGLLKTFLGIGSGISWIVYAVVFGLGLAVGTSGAAFVQQLRLDKANAETKAVQATVDSYQREARDADDRADVTATTAKQYLSAYNDQKARAEALDAQATQQAKDAAARFADLDRQKAAAETRADVFKTELERKANAPGATAADVGRAAIGGLR